MEAWNEGPGKAGAATARPLDNGRRAALAARVREHGEPAVFDAIAKLGRSGWHCGGNGGSWRANLGWLLKSPENFQKALEMDPTAPAPPTATNGSLVAAILARPAGASSRRGAPALSNPKEHP